MTPLREGAKASLLVATWVSALAYTAACRDVSSYDTGTGHYEGVVVPGAFVRSGVGAGVRLCLTLDTSRIADAPGTITSSDGSFVRAALRPLAPVERDPLSTLSFGSGRTKNHLFAASLVRDAGPEDPLLVVVSLMDAGNVEVRLLAPGTTTGAPTFAVFPLERQPGACPF